LGRIGYWLGSVDSVTGQGIDVVAKLLGTSWKPMGLDLVLAVIGAVILVVLAVQRGLGSRWAMAALVLGGQVGLVAVGMRADFSRYLLPVLIATTVCGGLVVGTIWDAIWLRIARRRETSAENEQSAMAGEPARS
jgi:hypothetical protein